MLSSKWTVPIVGLVMLLLISALLTVSRPLFGTPSVFNAARWLMWSRSYKSAVLAQPDSTDGYLKHVEWDSWGWGGEDTVVYVVFDPTDSLFQGASSHEPGQHGGIPCKVFRVRRLESQWYTVHFYTNKIWRPGC
jgi:hypothetical protein